MTDLPDLPAPISPLPTCAGTYFVQWAEHPESVKIGRARNIARRMHALAAGFNGTLVLLAYTCEPSDEGRYHERFAADRGQREWFNATPALAEAIRGVRAASSSTPRQVVPPRIPSRITGLIATDRDAARTELLGLLAAARGNRTTAARNIGVSHRTLCRWIVSLGIWRDVDRLCFLNGYKVVRAARRAA